MNKLSHLIYLIITYIVHIICASYPVTWRETLDIISKWSHSVVPHGMTVCHCYLLLDCQYFSNYQHEIAWYAHMIISITMIISYIGIRSYNANELMTMLQYVAMPSSQSCISLPIFISRLSILCKHVTYGSLMCFYDDKEAYHKLMTWIISCVEHKHNNFACFTWNMNTSKYEALVACFDWCITSWIMHIN